jgi:VWFA-related protein
MVFALQYTRQIIKGEDLKKGIFIIGILSLILFASGQEIQEEAIAVNIEVPVRVFTKGQFVEELSIDDFEVYEDGVLQKIEALYLVKKTVIEREETELDKKMARRIYLPEVSRTFVLMFEMTDYFPQVEETLTYFFENVFLPDDSLYVVTPKKTYSLKKEFLDKTPREVIVDQLKNKLSKDIRLASRELKSLFVELQELSEQLRSNVSGQIMGAIGDVLRRIRDYRYFDEKKLMEFKDQLKDIEGQKYVFLFYQKNVIPIPGKIGKLDDFDDLGRPMIAFNVDKVKKDFSDSLITINFIFVTKTDLYHIDGYRMNPAEQSSDQETVGLKLLDQSAEIFGAFHEMADATGGITDSSANVAASFEKAAIASENYYLLYYTPKDYKSDGKFKSIKVTVKEKSYTVTHRAGYIAD